MAGVGGVSDREEVAKTLMLFCLIGNVSEILMLLVSIVQNMLKMLNVFSIYSSVNHCGIKKEVSIPVDPAKRN